MFQAAPVRLYDHGCVNDVNLTRGFGKTSHAGELRSAPLLFTQVCLLWKFGATNPECEHLENFEVVHHPAVVWNLQFSHHVLHHPLRRYVAIGILQPERCRKTLDHINAIHKLDVFSSTSLLKKVGVRVVKFIKKHIL